MRAKRSSWPWILGGAVVVGAGVGLTLAVTQRQALPAPVGGAGQLPVPVPADDSSTQIPAHPVAPHQVADPDDDTDDETALARMLSSEVSLKHKTDRQIFEERLVIGWITVQRARRHKNLSLYQFVTNGRGYGGSKGRHASTAHKPSEKTRQLARELLSGAVEPSAAIRKHRPGSWFERDQGQPDEDLIEKQADWEEGIYARLGGSKWMLYSSDTRPIAVAPFKTASARLDAVPTVPALDQPVA